MVLLFVRRCGCSAGGLQGGLTALICAAEYGHTSCARLLIDAGADKDAKDEVRFQSLLCQATFLRIICFSHLTLSYSNLCHF